jgi:hypothetical protein
MIRLGFDRPEKMRACVGEGQTSLVCLSRLAVLLLGECDAFVADYADLGGLH